VLNLSGTLQSEGYQPLSDGGRAVRARGHFPTDEAALKLLYLVLNRSEKEWTMPAREWSMA